MIRANRTSFDHRVYSPPDASARGSTRTTHTGEDAHTNSQSVVERMVVSLVFISSTHQFFHKLRPMLRRIKGNAAPSCSVCCSREHGLDRRTGIEVVAKDGQRLVSRRGPQGATGAGVQDRKSQ
jgi:hypothetical protein